MIYKKLWNAEPENRKAIEFVLKAFVLAKQIHFVKSIIDCGNQETFRISHSDLYTAIPILMETKQIAEKASDKEDLAWLWDF